MPDIPFRFWFFVWRGGGVNSRCWDRAYVARKIESSHPTTILTFDLFYRICIDSGVFLIYIFEVGIPNLVLNGSWDG